MQGDDERALLRRVAAGDQHALRDLYAEYRPRLWGYLFHQLDGDAGWTEELTQDVFVAVWRSAGTYRGDAQVATWLFRIAHNLAANARRARDRRPQTERLAIGDSGGSDELDERDDLPSGVSHEDAVLDRLTLASALGQLAARHREVLDLVFVQGFSMAEVSTILGVPVGTVKSRVSYARRALHAHLAHLAAETCDSGKRIQTAGMAGETCREER